MGIRVSALDHVHIYVADPRQAADWYGRVLGLQIHPSSTNLEGKRSLYMATPRGRYCATFFPGKPPSDGDHTTAFRVPGTGFIAFGAGLPDPDIPARGGEPLQMRDADDHGLARSYHFQDPDGNHLEVTTYDHRRVRDWFRGVAQ